MYANHRHYTLFILACLTFITTAAGYTFLKYRIFTQAVEVVHLTRQVQEMEKHKKRELDVTTAYSKLSKEQEFVSSLVVKQEEIVLFIEDVERVGDQAGVDLEITNIHSKPAGKSAQIKNNFTQVEAHVEISGDWANVLRALKLIEHMPYGITIDKIALGAILEEKASAATGSAQPKTKGWKLSLDIKALAL